MYIPMFVLMIAFVIGAEYYKEKQYLELSYMVFKVGVALAVASLVIEGIMRYIVLAIGA